jgi:hypothetical protein
MEKHDAMTEAFLDQFGVDDFNGPDGELYLGWLGVWVQAWSKAKTHYQEIIRDAAQKRSREHAAMHDHSRTFLEDDEGRWIGYACCDCDWEIDWTLFGADPGQSE